ncbi:hypothetical protein [Streptomyces tropicalis]|uniref:Secreted protein n=1 Tax=Streptomyces tropicalis TaxID=3034234 RepID=A0ABT6A5G5_9ACTN|nr:hypothetical protein [Streptomyces tropicalis]MDF3299718.1 hypothetical protein [Streptomyces tropicalis]
MSKSGKFTTGIVTALSLAALTAAAAPASATPVAVAKSPHPVAASCGEWIRAGSLPFKWSTVKDGCGHFGRPGLRMGYSWAVWKGGAICVKVEGFKNGKKTWYNAGCGKSGSVTVPWGNVLAEKQMQVKNAALFNWK